MEYLCANNKNKIICIGRNYLNHINELNNAAPSKPLLFIKPVSSITNKFIHISKKQSLNCDIEHEVELAVVIRDKCKNLTPKQAMDNILGFTLAIDLTNRKAQSYEKSKGHSWTLSKCVDDYTPMCNQYIKFINASNCQAVDLWLKVNGVTKQNGNTRDMIFEIPELLSYTSSEITLNRGDIVLTGTPEGVGPVQIGDVVEIGCAVNNDTTSNNNHYSNNNIESNNDDNDNILTCAFTVKQKDQPPEGVITYDNC